MNTVVENDGAVDTSSDSSSKYECMNVTYYCRKTTAQLTRPLLRLLTLNVIKQVAIGGIRARLRLVPCLKFVTSCGLPCDLPCDLLRDLYAQISVTHLVTCLVNYPVTRLCASSYVTYLVAYPGTLFLFVLLLVRGDLSFRDQRHLCMPWLVLPWLGRVRFEARAPPRRALRLYRLP